MSEQQLERSVLEAKEREELFAIADALGTKPASRAKKSDLVTLILRATGVEAAPEGVAEAPAAPKRTRTRRTAAATVSRSEDEVAQLPLEGDDNASEDVAATPESAPPAAPAASNGNGRAAGDKDSGPPAEPRAAEAKPASSPTPR